MKVSNLVTALILLCPLLSHAQSSCQGLFSPLWKQLIDTSEMKYQVKHFDEELQNYTGFTSTRFRNILKNTTDEDFITPASKTWIDRFDWARKKLNRPDAPEGYTKESALEHFDRVAEITSDKVAFREYAMRLRTHILKHLENVGLLTETIMHPDPKIRRQYILDRKVVEDEIFLATESLLREDLGYDIVVEHNKKFYDKELKELSDLQLRGHLFWDHYSNERYKAFDVFVDHGVMMHVLQWHYVAWQLKIQYGYSETELVDSLRLLGTRAGEMVFAKTFDTGQDWAQKLFQPEHMKTLLTLIMPVF
ncbi:MAG: hypothetical protein CL677_06925 [Bdellovibrionaceae bacterium]|nr:hypothetical protein [Pseudobdellovibrionaceae bacterium]|tara:strand:- start:22730 stop:23650 length:921 start_codon:yes stop_codon:yes gene_type:complete